MATTAEMGREMNHELARSASWEVLRTHAGMRPTVETIGTGCSVFLADQ